MRHVALFTWKPGTGEQDVRALSDGLRTLPGLIPELLAYRFGPDLGLSEGNANFAVVADFAGLEEYRAYVAHPAHQEVIDRLLKPILERRTAVQLDV